MYEYTDRLPWEDTVSRSGYTACNDAFCMPDYRHFDADSAVDAVRVLLGWTISNLAILPGGPNSDTPETVALDAMIVRGLDIDELAATLERDGEVEVRVPNTHTRWTLTKNV